MGQECGSVTEHLPRMPEALGSILSDAQNKTRYILNVTEVIEMAL